MGRTLYDPPSGWRYGFPKEYSPLPGETLEETLLRDGYPQSEIDNSGAKHCRFIGGDMDWPLSAEDLTAQRAVEGDTEREQLVPANDNTPVRERIGSFMQTFSGKAVYPMDLREEDIDIKDIAHSLSMQCRYAGHTQRFYSVAEHSVHVARWCRQWGADAALYGLLHDATEAYLVDVPRPVKPFLTGYKEAEERASFVILDRYGLIPIMHPAVDKADRRILADERAALMAPCVREWDNMGEPLGVTIEGWLPARAEREFLALFDELYGED